MTTRRGDGIGGETDEQLDATESHGAVFEYVGVADPGSGDEGAVSAAQVADLEGVVAPASAACMRETVGSAITTLTDAEEPIVVEDWMMASWVPRCVGPRDADHALGAGLRKRAA